MNCCVQAWAETCYVSLISTLEVAPKENKYSFVYYLGYDSL